MTFEERRKRADTIAKKKDEATYKSRVADFKKVRPQQTSHSPSTPARSPVLKTPLMRYMSGARPGNPSLLKDYRSSRVAADTSPEIIKFSGNIDLTKKHPVRNHDGSYSTIRSMSFGNETGQQILVPTVINKDGKLQVVSDDEAIENYYKTGEYLGKYSSIAEAENAAQLLHDSEAKKLEKYYSYTLGNNKPVYKTQPKPFAPKNTNDVGIIRTPYNNTAEKIAYDIGKGMGSKRPDTILGGLQYNLARGAQGAVGAVEGITDFAVGNLDTGLSWLTSLGGTKPNAVSEWWKKGAQSVYDSNVSQAMEKGINDEVKTYIPKWTKVGGDIYNVAGNMMTSIGAGKAASGATKIASDVAGKLAIGASAGGNAAQQAYGEGTTAEKAAAFGNVAGALEATIESISGGIPGLGKGVVDKAISKFVKYPKALQVVTDIVGEGGEEVLSDIITPYLQRAIYNPEAEDATLEEMAKDFAMGAALSGLMQGAQGIGNINLGKAQDIAQSPVSTTTSTQDVATQPIQSPTIAPSVFESNLPVETQNAVRGIVEPATAIEPMAKPEAVASSTGTPYTATLYHGSGAEASKIYNGIEYPVAGQGKYYATSEKAARHYGDNVEAVDVHLENPIVIKDDADWRKLTSAAGWQYSNMYSAGKDAAIAASNNLRKYILSTGHDGLVIEYESDHEGDINIRTGNTVKTLDRVFSHDQIVDYNEENAEQSDLTPLNKMPEMRGSAENNIEPVSNNKQSGLHIDNRTPESVGKRSIKAFQYDHPELHGYFETMAQALANEVESQTMQDFMRPSAKRGSATAERVGTRYDAKGPVKELMDMGLSKPQILQCCDDIINDRGSENYAAAKRVELVLDNMLTNGYVAYNGVYSPTIFDYVEAKQQIVGAKTQAQRDAEVNEWLAAVEGLPQGTGAASSGFDPYTNMQNRYGNIPVGENPARVVDTPLQTADNNIVSRGVRTAMEAQATPDTALGDIQDAVVDGKFSYMPVTDEAAKGRAEQTIQQKGWDNAVKDWTADARSGKVSKDLIVLGQTLYNNAMNAGNTKGGVDILVDLVKMSRSGAQATQANRVLKTLSPEYQLYALQRSVQSMSDELTQKFAKKGFKGITLNEALVKEYMDAQTQEVRDTVMDGIKDDIASQIPSTWMDKWNAWRYLSMLGNPRTHVRNIVGNAGFTPVRMIKNTLALGIERVSGVKNRTKAALTFKDSPLIKHAFSDYNVVSEQIMSLGKMDNFAGDIDSRRQIFKNPLLEGTRNFNTKALDAEDVWFAKPAYASALAGWYKANGVTADALTNGEVSQTTIDNARAYAIREAQRATYRDSNAFSDWVSKLGRGYTGNNWAAKTANVLVEGVLPFKRTPANILARAVEYSPVGLTKGLTNDLIKVYNGNMEAWQAIDNISAGLTGTALLGLGAYLASMGLLSGGASDDKKQREIDKLTGWQEYALNIGGKSITLDWLAPEALPLFVGVELWNAATNKSEDGVSLVTFLDRLGGITEPMFEMSMLQGVNDLFDSIKYSDKNSLVGVATTAAANYLSQGLPTLFGQIERVFEPERKSTYTDPKSDVPTTLQYMLGKVSGKVPIWEYQQSTYRDGFGNTQSNGTAGQRLINNLLNPAYVNNLKSDKVTDELQRLNDENYLESVPDAPEKSFDYGGEEHNLSPDEYSKFQKTAGSKSHKLISNILKDSGYKKLNDEKKAKLIQNLMGYANDTAKREYIGGKYKSNSYEKTFEAEKQGISPTNFFVYKTAVSDIDDNDSVTQAEAAQALENTDITTRYKGKLWQLQNADWKPEKNPYTGTLAQAGFAPKAIIRIMNKRAELEDEYEDYERDEAKQLPSREALKTSIFKTWLQQEGYMPDTVSFILDEYKFWNHVPAKTTKQSESYLTYYPYLAN